MTAMFDSLPDVLKAVRTKPLFVMRLSVRKLQIIGATPGGLRRVGVVPGGVFEGERLSGEVLEGGADWQSVRSDGGTTLDVRLVLKTRDDALIGMTYRGIRQGPPEAIARLEKGRGDRSRKLLFPDGPSLRDRRGAVRLAEQCRGGRYRTSLSRRARLQRLRSSLT